MCLCVTHYVFLATDPYKVVTTTRTQVEPNRKRKHGLTWLFPHKKMTTELDIDERIRGTWMTLEASTKESRVETITHQFTRLRKPAKIQKKILKSAIIIYFHIPKFFTQLSFLCRKLPFTNIFLLGFKKIIGLRYSCT